MKLELLLKFLSTSLFRGRDVRLGEKFFKLSKTRGSLRFYKFGHMMLIEQNPLTQSEYAKKARQGKNIAWLIDTKEDKYLYRIEDGKATRL